MKKGYLLYIKMEIPTNYILFLKGVFPEDCSKVEDQYIENLNDNASFIDDMHKNGDIKRKVQYDKIQKHFYSIKTWVESTKNIKKKKPRQWVVFQS